MLFPSITPVSLNKHFSLASDARLPLANRYGDDFPPAEAPCAPVAPVLQPATVQARSLAAFLLAATLAALLVAADQLIETWTDDHLLMGWVVLWTVAFVGLAFLARPMRLLSIRLANAWVAWLAQQSRRAQDERFWADACLDPRLMADIVAAQTRAHKG